MDLPIDEASFRDELADCRTFGFLHEVEALRAAGLARGGSLENAVVIDGEIILNPEGLRRPDEFVRHKALDAVGDLYVLGHPLIGPVRGDQGRPCGEQRPGPRASGPSAGWRLTTLSPVWPRRSDRRSVRVRRWRNPWPHVDTDDAVGGAKLEVD